ncbi:MAG: hypothetical protein IPL43_07650 [Micropruina sp.]|nr:hypothetical protein [Micropruina sp.]
MRNSQKSLWSKLFAVNDDGCRAPNRVGQPADPLPRTRLVGIVPIGTSSTPSDLFEFETADGLRVSLHEVDCVAISFQPARALLTLEMAWDATSPIQPPASELERFTLKFSGAFVQHWEADKENSGQHSGQVRSLGRYGGRGFALQLADLAIHLEADEVALVLQGGEALAQHPQGGRGKAGAR